MGLKTDCGTLYNLDRRALNSSLEAALKEGWTQESDIHHAIVDGGFVHCVDICRPSKTRIRRRNAITPKHRRRP